MAGSKRGKRGDTELGELNLVPIMALLVVLIPVLLFAFNFFEIKIQAVSAPRMGSGQTKQKDPDKKPLNLTVLITSDGFVIKKQAELTAEPEPKIFKTTFDVEGRSVEEYNYPALYNRLVQIKKQYPEEKTVNIGGDLKSTRWKTLARTIDTCRVMLEKDEYDGLKDWSEAEIRTKPGASPDDPPEEVTLFPGVVFVVAE